ncbi:hypothetical protein LTS08_008584 [Lithohypha guttulata]|uniref:uncharacterized protein n=1 Tax=Lithohypha guttulata TaxID=1690604 RepID=UPI002DDECA73|nr:hypothetical protein LTR51_002960 [Lithohypha guttulata]KAK5094532.1 hypothetical protein LTS08_008584 [Lithohypha guttulata]
MPKDKEKSINPAQQQRKLEKAKALKKGKAELQARRNEKLARRNPNSIQRQIDDLKALEAAGDIKPREKAILADLERDLKAVNKARETLGDKAPFQSSRPQRSDIPQSTLGKRHRDGERKHNERREGSGNESSDTDESVRNIPWPEDTPPPIPNEFKRNRQNPTVNFGSGSRTYNAPAEPAQAKTTYESAPQIRDLKKEAVSRFVPNIVKRKQEAVRGSTGQLLEPEELDRLEQEGYIQSNVPGGPSTQAAQSVPKFSQYAPKNINDLQRLKDEEEAFEREMAMQDADQADDPFYRKVADDPAEAEDSFHTEVLEEPDEYQNSIEEDAKDPQPNQEHDPYQPRIRDFAIDPLSRPPSLNASFRSDATEVIPDEELEAYRLTIPPRSQPTPSFLEAVRLDEEAARRSAVPQPEAVTIVRRASTPPPPTRQVQMEEVIDEDLL